MGIMSNASQTIVSRQTTAGLLTVTVRHGNHAAEIVAELAGTQISDQRHISQLAKAATMANGQIVTHYVGSAKAACAIYAAEVVGIMAAVTHSNAVRAATPEGRRHAIVDRLNSSLLTERAEANKIFDGGGSVAGRDMARADHDASVILLAEFDLQNPEVAAQINADTAARVARAD